MNTRHILLLLGILLIVLLLQPRASWRSLSQAWAQRGWMLSVLVAVVVLYLLYGLYSLIRQGGLPTF